MTQVRSSISTKPKHRGTLRALGLRRIGATNELPDRPEIRGMVARVPHLVAVSVQGAPGSRHKERDGENGPENADGPENAEGPENADGPENAEGGSR